MSFHEDVSWPNHRFRSGPPQILISKFRGAAANFEVDFDRQNASVLPQDRAYRRRTPTHTTSHHSTGRVHLPRADMANARAHRGVLAQAIALRSPATDRAHLPALAPITSSAGGRRGGRSSLMASMNGLRSCSKTRLRRLVVWCLVVLLLLGEENVPKRTLANFHNVREIGRA